MHGFDGNWQHVCSKNLLRVFPRKVTVSSVLPHSVYLFLPVATVPK